MMTLAEIKAAVDAGKTVIYKGSPGYVVEKWTDNRAEPTYEIVFQETRYAWGLTHQDGVTMNGSPEDFTIFEDVDSAYLEDICPDCGSEVDWDQLEASTGGDTYRGTCTGCDSVFIAEHEAHLKEVRRE